MTASTIALLLRRGLKIQSHRRRRQTRNISAGTAAEVCEPRLVMSAVTPALETSFEIAAEGVSSFAMADDHVNAIGPDATHIVVDLQTGSGLLSGEVDHINDTDVFQFFLESPSFVQVSLTNPSPGNQASVMLVSDQFPNDPYFLTNSASRLSSGRWYVFVGGNPGFQTGQYQYTLQTEQAPNDDHIDRWGPEATVVQPVDRPHELRFSGTIDHFNDRDFFQFSMPHTAAEVVIEFQQWPTDGEVWYELLDTNGQHFTTLTSGPEFPHQSISITLPAGQWFLAAGGYPSFSKGSYSLTMHWDDFPDAPEDTPQPNWPISPESPQMLNGLLEDGQDIDVRRFQIDEFSDLHLSPSEQFRLILQNSAGENLPLQDGRARLPSGTYFLSVSQLASDDTGMAYAFNASLLPVRVPAVQILSGHGSTIDPDPRFTWAPVEDAVSYEIFISHRGETRPIFRQQNVMGTEFQLPMDLPNADYTVWVRAHLPNDRVSFWGPGSDLTTGAKPEKPTGLQHQSSASGIVAWPAVQGAESYDIWLGSIDPVTRTRSRITQFTTNQTSWEIPAEIKAGTYGVWVRAVGVGSDGSSHHSQWSDGQIFELEDMPAAPVIDNWTVSTFVNSLHVDRVYSYDQWSPPLFSAAAVISLGEPPDPFAPIPLLSGSSAAMLVDQAGIDWPAGRLATVNEFRIIDTNTNETLWQQSQQQNYGRGGSYIVLYRRDAQHLAGRSLAVQTRTRSAQPTNWYLRGEDRPQAEIPRRISEWSEAFPFAIDQTNLQIHTSDLSNNGRPVLTWPAVPDRIVYSESSGLASPELLPAWPPARNAAETAQYELRIDRVSNSQTVVTEESLSTTEFAVPSQLSPDVYAAQVRATYSDGTAGEWSAAYHFRVMSAPVLITGGLETTVDATPNISWQPTNDASSYELWIGLKGSRIASYRASGLTETAHRVETPLTNGTYDVFVRAHHANGTMSRWGMPHSLQLGVAPIVQASGRIISWQPVNGATRYELWVNRIDADSNASARRVMHDDQMFATSATLPSDAGTYRIWVRAIRDEAGDTYISNWSRAIDH